MTGEVVSIHVAPEAGAAAETVEAAQLVADQGVSGDRYFEGRGTFSAKLAGSPGWEVTLIEVEEIDRYNATHGTQWSAGDFRRNIVTRGVRLNELVGTRFTVGTATLEGVRLCEPCAYLGSLLGAEIVEGMVHRAGLRARVVEGGEVRSGDPVAAREATTSR